MIFLTKTPRKFKGRRNHVVSLSFGIVMLILATLQANDDIVPPQSLFHIPLYVFFKMSPLLRAPLLWILRGVYWSNQKSYVCCLIYPSGRGNLPDYQISSCGLWCIRLQSYATCWGVWCAFDWMCVDIGGRAPLNEYGTLHHVLDNFSHILESHMLGNSLNHVNASPAQSSSSCKFLRSSL